jgi:hypothetical protein
MKPLPRLHARELRAGRLLNAKKRGAKHRAGPRLILSIHLMSQSQSHGQGQKNAGFAAKTPASLLKRQHRY